MKIEMGKKYQTRDGRAVRVLCVDRKDDKPVVALVPSDDGGHDIVYSYHSDGRYDRIVGYARDLIEVKEKKSVVGYAHVVSDYRYNPCGRDLFIFKDVKTAEDNLPAGYTIAKLTIEWEC